MSLQTDKDWIVKDTFLSDILNTSAYRIMMPGEELDQASMDRIRTRQKENVFLNVKIPVRSVKAMQQMLAMDFYLADTLLTFEKPKGPAAVSSTDATIRLARPEDEERAARIGQTSFVHDRFHADPNVSKEAADRLKEEWVRNFFKGKRGSHMVIAEQDQRVTGFTQCLVADNVLTIDLIAVDPAFQGQGIAGQMMAFAEDKIEGVQRIRVGTQITNAPSIRAYEKSGFRFQEAAYVLHYHGRGS